MTAAAEVIRHATISDDGIYRYTLARFWAFDTPVRWIMLNPSTADAEVDDPTIRRCMGFARLWGYGGIVVHNLYALRATDPHKLGGHPDPVGPDNDRYLAGTGPKVLTVCAWGVNADRGRAHRPAKVLDLLRANGVTPYCLGRTKAGQPRHPLYLRADTALEAM